MWNLLRDTVYSVRSPRLWMRPWRSSDAKDLRQAVDADPEARRLPWLTDLPPAEIDLNARLRRLRADFIARRDVVFGIWEGPSGPLVGAGGLQPQIGRGGWRMAGWIRADRTAQGYGTEVGSVLVKLAFEVYRTDFLEVQVAPGTSGRRVAEKLWFLPVSDETVRLLGVDYSKSPGAAMEISVLDAEDLPVRLPSSRLDL